MKSCKTIIGTVIIEIEKGTGLGEIHQVLVEEGVNLTFVVKSKHSVQPFAMLPGKNIHGIGDFAVMVENSSALQDLDEADLQLLNDKQGNIFDEMVITIDGNKIGRVVDYHIDPKNEIGYLIVNPENAGEEIQIPKSRILMIGKEYIILNDDKKEDLYSEDESETVDLTAKATELINEKVAGQIVAKKPAETAFQEELDDVVDFEKKNLTSDSEESDKAEAVEKEVSEDELEEVSEVSGFSFEPTETAAEFSEFLETENLPKEQDGQISEDLTVAEVAENLDQETQAEIAEESDAAAENTEVQETSEDAETEEENISEADFEEVSEDQSSLSNTFDEEMFQALEQLKQDEGIKEAPSLSIEPVAEPVSLEEVSDETESLATEKAEAELQKEAAGISEVQEETPANVVPISERNVFLNQQKRLLLGKRLQKDLLDVNGETILFAGDIVTDDTIDLLRRIDRKLLVRLAECVV